MQALGIREPHAFALQRRFFFGLQLRLLNLLHLETEQVNHAQALTLIALQAVEFTEQRVAAAVERGDLGEKLLILFITQGIEEGDVVLFAQQGLVLVLAVEVYQ
ncbi:MAG: hypothetical protein BWY76_02801 [bacterium ADurb.Bin429]|nr:MAG: hypothetical protein BWY76_02801 [bacterium ADurb.Bin429]